MVTLLMATHEETVNGRGRGLSVQVPVMTAEEFFPKQPILEM